MKEHWVLTLVKPHATANTQNSKQTRFSGWGVWYTEYEQNIESIRKDMICDISKIFDNSAK